MMTDREYRLSTVRAQLIHRLISATYQGVIFRKQSTFHETKLNYLYQCPFFVFCLSKESEQHQLNQRLNLPQIHSRTYLCQIHSLTDLCQNPNLDLNQILNPHQNLLQIGATGTWFLMLQPSFRVVSTSSRMGKTFMQNFRFCHWSFIKKHATPLDRAVILKVSLFFFLSVCDHCQLIMEHCVSLSDISG